MVFKEKVKKCFNSKAYNYESAADIQPKIAQQLAQLLNNTNAKTILEIGCGTGSFSEYLVQLFPTAHITLVDIAPAMVDICQVRFADYPQVEVLCMDGEQIPANRSYDLIVSSMALHWFVDIKRSLQQLWNSLLPGGKMFFAILGDNSLQEWRQHCHAQQVSLSTPVFPSATELPSIFDKLHLQIEMIKQPYANAMHFFKTLKGIGAHASHAQHVPFSVGTLRHLLRTWNSNNQDITVSYEVVYGSYEKI